MFSINFSTSSALMPACPRTRLKCYSFSYVRTIWDQVGSPRFRRILLILASSARCSASNTFTSVSSLPAGPRSSSSLRRMRSPNCSISSHSFLDSFFGIIQDPLKYRRNSHSRSRHGKRVHPLRWHVRGSGSSTYQVLGELDEQFPSGMNRLLPPLLDSLFAPSRVTEVGKLVCRCYEGL